jgi:hypothetical protein
MFVCVELVYVMQLYCMGPIFVLLSSYFLICVCSGKIPFLVSLFGTATSARGSSMVSVAVEVWWLFAFLTAKEDAAVDRWIVPGLYEVGTVLFIS